MGKRGRTVTATKGRIDNLTRDHKREKIVRGRKKTTRGKERDFW